MSPAQSELATEICQICYLDGVCVYCLQDLREESGNDFHVCNHCSSICGICFFNVIWIMKVLAPWWLLSIPTCSSSFLVPTNMGVWIVPAVVHCHASIKNRAARRVPDEKADGGEQGEEAEQRREEAREKR